MGGYHILALTFLIPACLHLSKLQISFDDYYKKTLILVLVVVTIFISRNAQRLINENKLYRYNILENLNYKFIGGDKNYYFRYNNHIKENEENLPKKLFWKRNINFKQQISYERSLLLVTMFNKVGTYRSTINSAISLANYSKNQYSVKIINSMW